MHSCKKKRKKTKFKTCPLAQTTEIYCLYFLAYPTIRTPLTQALLNLLVRQIKIQTISAIRIYGVSPICFACVVWLLELFPIASQSRRAGVCICRVRDEQWVCNAFKTKSRHI